VTKALISPALYGTAEAMAFVRNFFAAKLPANPPEKRWPALPESEGRATYINH
jgi:hypothetical protein